ncbi:MAG: hypothetical protein K2L07_08475 [Lachnospiraceae bacterium]|nr:hypothetical protein [Lachnospiraceae bacterium]
MKDSEKTILLSIAGIAIIVLSAIYVMKPNIEEYQKKQQEAQQLQARLQELQAKQADREKYLEDTEKYNKEFEEVLNYFPADLNQEITVMFLDGIKKDNEMDFSKVQLGEEELFYTLGSNGADATLGGTTDSTGTTEATSEAESTEEATTEAAASGELAEGEAPIDDSAYNCFRAEFPMEYYGSYSSLKNVIDYIDAYQDRITINSIDITYKAENDVYEGNMTMYCYAVRSGDRPERSIELNDVETGVDNIFIGTGSIQGEAESDGLNKYDENDGAAIESNYDFYAMLNPSTSDVSAKVVGQNGAGKEASVITNSDNSVSTLSYDFYEKDGKNYCKYTLDGTSYEAEVTSAEDIKILLQSSARKGDDDKVGIRVTVRNTTSLPVYVKVSGDDSVSARVDVTGKTGSVKVYK